MNKIWPWLKNPMHIGTLILFWVLIYVGSWLGEWNQLSTSPEHSAQISPFRIGGQCFPIRRTLQKLRTLSFHPIRRLSWRTLQNPDIIQVDNWFFPTTTKFPLNCFILQKKGLAVWPHTCTPKGRKIGKGTKLTGNGDMTQFYTKSDKEVTLVVIAEHHYSKCAKLTKSSALHRSQRA